jgi:hypothetical protein
MKTSARFLMGVLGAIAWTCANAQVAPLHVGTINPTLDEFGAPLKGTSPASPKFGLPHVTGEVVQILTAPSGIWPPAVDGTPNPANVLLHEARIGQGTDPGSGASGRFGASAPSRPVGQQVFARVFNKPTLAESSFYSDSQVFSVSTTFNDPFVATLTKTDTPLDSADPDLDGLINSWEKSLQSDPDNPDTDGDGMADGPEFRAGTQVTNETSVLAMVELVAAPPDNLDVIWDSVAGKQYQVEHKAGDLTDTNDPFYAISGVLSATDLVTRTTITNALLSSGGHYRVKLIEP